MLGNSFPPPMQKERTKALRREKSNFYQCIHILQDYNRVKLRKKLLLVKILVTSQLTTVINSSQMRINHSSESKIYRCFYKKLHF